jgi:hypothetical protein
VVLPCYISWLENHVYLSRGVQVAGAAWRAATRIVAGIGDLVQRIGDGQAQVGNSVVRQLRGRVTLCAVVSGPSSTQLGRACVGPKAVSHVSAHLAQAKFPDILETARNRTM